MANKYNFSQITVDDALSSTSENPVQNKVVNTALNNKVDKVSGKGLSTNDFTTTYKSNVDSNTSARHTHLNKTVLDGITSSDITNWNNKLSTAPVTSVNGKTGVVTLTQDNIGDGTTYKRVSSTEKTTWNNKSNFSGSYNDLTNKPTIPTKTSQLTNDSSYVTSSSLGTQVTYSLSGTTLTITTK